MGLYRLVVLMKTYEESSPTSIVLLDFSGF